MASFYAKFYTKMAISQTNKKSSSLIFGARAVIETIQAGQTIEKVFLQRRHASTQAKELQALLQQYSIPFGYVPIEKLNRLTRGNHQGVAAIVSPIAFPSLEMLVPTIFEQGRSPLLIVLDGVTDVHNVGAIARTAICMGVDALVVPIYGSASISGAAMKTSAGALATLPVCRVPNLTTALHYLQASGLTLVACDADASQSPQEIDFNLPTALVFGAEGTGIAPTHLNLATHRVSIPMRGPIASLNVSVAAGIVLYEAFRQRDT